MAQRLPGIRQRMESAAFELFARQGYAATTPAQIAALAGTTERTFYRHFGDRAGVALGDERAADERFAARIAEHRPGDSPLRTICQAVRAASEEGPGPVSRRQRLAVQRTDSELRDRSAAQQARWTVTAAGLLRGCGVDGETARLTASLGVPLSGMAVEDWLDGRTGDLDERIRQVTGEAAAQLAAARP